MPAVAGISAGPIGIIGAGGLGVAGAEIGVAAGIAAYCNPAIPGIGSAVVNGMTPGPGGPFNSLAEFLAWLFGYYVGPGF